MNYYKRHIGDYMKDASHLSLLEHGIYMRLLDVYYTREGAIPADQAARLIGARSKDEKEALEVVLGEFFKLADGFYMQARCELEIKAMQTKAETNRVVGKRGGRQKKETDKDKSANPEETQTVSDGNPEETQTVSKNNPSHKPIANTYSVSNDTGGEPPVLQPDEIIFGYGVPLLVSAGTPEKQARSFLGMLRKRSESGLIDALRGCIKAKPLQPMEWLAAALPIDCQTSKKASKHAGFSDLDYREGIAEDGTFA